MSKSKRRKKSIQKTKKKFADPVKEKQHGNTKIHPKKSQENTNRGSGNRNAPCENETRFAEELVRWWSKGRSSKQQ